MSLLQQHFEERREYVFNRLKQPEYMERSIEKVRQAQKRLKIQYEQLKIYYSWIKQLILVYQKLLNFLFSTLLIPSRLRMSKTCSILYEKIK